MSWRVTHKRFRRYFESEERARAYAKSMRLNRALIEEAPTPAVVVPPFEARFMEKRRRRKA